ncbi:AraC family transcriptional regulator [Brucella gallinifaecis]|uniref:helix-turn-helix domain-containing protein n=1 Tax=Brucella gallinifaecis TaxID=215590 RepID=UPI002361A393|nr:AraC family transcriptional regulator [Brucella gallinifaecis]
MIYVTVYVHADLCKDLPAVVQTIALSSLLKAILADFAERHITSPKTPEDERLAMVLVDQVCLARRYDTYLPFTKDNLIAPIILALQSTPNERRSLAEWARLAGVTERTLSRRWQQATGIAFNEWRQRQKLVVALAMLEQGDKVQSVAASLGYSDPSAFIAMFRRQTGFSPTNLVQKI